MADSTDRLQIQTEFARALRGDDLRPEGVQSVATPVDTFVQPEEDSQLKQLARSLSSLSPEVGKLSDFLSERRQASDQTHAEADVSEAVRNGAKTYADMVKANPAMAGASPYYRMYAKKQLGQLMAGKMQSDFEADATRDLAGATDLSQFDEYAKQYQSKWIKDHGATGDVAFMEGFDPHSNAAMADARSRFAEAAGKNLQSQTVGGLIQTQGSIIRNGITNKLTHAQIAEQLNAQADQAIAAGVRGDLVNQANAAAISNYAEASKDNSVLDLGGLVKAGTGQLGDTETFATARHKSEPYITSAVENANSMADKKRKDDMEAARAQNLTSAYQKLDADPHADVRPELQALEEAHDYTGIENLESHQTAAIRQSQTDDYEPFTAAMAEAVNPDNNSLTKSHVSAMIGNHIITAEHGNQLIGILDQRENAAKAADAKGNVLKDINYKVVSKALKADFAQSFAPGATSSPAYAEASVELFNQMTSLHANPAYLSASPQQQLAMVESVHQQIISVYAPGTIQRHVDAASKANTGPDTKENADKLFAQSVHSEMARNHGTLSAATKAKLHERHIDTGDALSTFFQTHGVLPTTPSK